MKIKNSLRGRRGLPPIRNSQTGTKTRLLNPCLGVKLKLLERDEKRGPWNSNSNGAFNCHHRPEDQAHGTANSTSSIYSRGQHEDWISEHLYKKYTDTDSRPLSPVVLKYRDKNKPRRVNDTSRKCLTPEPTESSICHFHQRRVLILDLRKVKSVDVVTRQDSLSSTATCSVADGDDEHIIRSNDPHGISRASTQMISSLRSIPPKRKMVLKRRIGKPEQGSVEYERSTSPKILEGLIFPPLHSSVLALLSQRSTSGNQSLKVGTGQGLAGSMTKQKLRRHGRRRRNESQEKLATEGGSVEGENQERPLMGGNEVTADLPEGKEEMPAGSQPEINNGDEGLSPANTVSGSGQQLFQILDETLSKTRWYLTEETMQNEIRDLEKVLGRNDRRMEKMNLHNDLDALSLLPKPRKKRLASLCQLNQVN